MAPIVPANGKFTTGMCDCCAAPGGYGQCFMTGCCSCCAFGNNVAQLDPSSGVMCAGNNCGACCCFCLLGGVIPSITAILIGVPVPMSLACCIHVPVRRAIKAKYGIEPVEDCCADWMGTWCCPACYICQEGRELTIRQQTTHVPVMLVPVAQPVMMQPVQQPGM